MNRVFTLVFACLRVRGEPSIFEVPERVAHCLSKVTTDGMLKERYDERPIEGLEWASLSALDWQDYVDDLKNVMFSSNEAFVRLCHKRALLTRNITNEIRQLYEATMSKYTVPNCEGCLPAGLQEYFRILDKVIAESYTEHFNDMNDAAQRMEQGLVPRRWHPLSIRDACSGDAIYAVFCEMEQMDRWFGLHCGQPLDDPIAIDCPVSSGPTPRCVLPEILGENVNVSNLEYIAAPLRIRLGHLIVLNVLCDDGWRLKEHVLKVAPYIANRSVTVYENADTNCWPDLARNFASRVADGFGVVGWPTSNGDQKYQRLAQKIADEMEVLWNRKDTDKTRKFYALVYYPCTKTDCPIIYDEDWTRQGDQNCRDNEKLRRLNPLIRQHANVLLWHKDGNRCKSRDDYDKWMKKWEASIGALLNSTTNANPTEVLKKVDEFLSDRSERAWRASDSGPFRAMMVVACAYKFVWTELAWHYFRASSTTPSYERSRELEPEKHIFTGGRSPTSKCLEVIFVP